MEPLYPPTLVGDLPDAAQVSRIEWTAIDVHRAPDYTSRP